MNPAQPHGQVSCIQVFYLENWGLNPKFVTNCGTQGLGLRCTTHRDVHLRQNQHIYFSQRSTRLGISGTTVSKNKNQNQKG